MLADDFYEIFDVDDRVDELIIRVESYDMIDEVAERIEERLVRVSELEEDDFFMITPDQILEIFTMVIAILSGFFLAIASISLIVGSIGIANTMYAAVIERTREIGVMKSVGARNRDILALFMVESGLLGLIGGIIGVAIGLGLAKGVEFAVLHVTGVDYLTAGTPFWLFVFCIVFSFMVGVVSGSLPALRAARIRPSESLRDE